MFKIKFYASKYDELILKYGKGFLLFLLESSDRLVDFFLVVSNPAWRWHVSFNRVEYASSGHAFKVTLVIVCSKKR